MTWRNPTHQQQTAAVRTAIESLSKDTQSQVDDVNDSIAAITTPEGWHAPTLANSWENFGSGFATAGYRKDASGVVWVRGSIKNGTATVGTTLFTLPAGYRPTSTLVFTVLQAGTVLAQVNVASDGTVKLGVTLADSTFLSLNGVVFWTS